MREVSEIGLFSQVPAMDKKMSVSGDRPSLKKKGPRYGRRGLAGSFETSPGDGQDRDIRGKATRHDDREEHTIDIRV